MTVLHDAWEAAERRKLAALGEHDGAGLEAPDLFQQRTIFSGFDLDVDELREAARNRGAFLANTAAASDIPLSKVCATGWIDGLLIGLMVNRNNSSQ